MKWKQYQVSEPVIFMSEQTIQRNTNDKSEGKWMDENKVSESKRVSEIWYVCLHQNTPAPWPFYTQTAQNCSHQLTQRHLDFLFFHKMNSTPAYTPAGRHSQENHVYVRCQEVVQPENKS